MDAKTVFASKFLRGDDIGDGRVTVAIERIEMEEVGKAREEKPVIYFTGKSLGMVINATNWKTLRAMLGDETDDWIGQRITLYTAPVEFEGKTTMALRVLPKKPAAAAAQPAARPAQREKLAGSVPNLDEPHDEADGDDDIPF